MRAFMRAFLLCSSIFLRAFLLCSSTFCLHCLRAFLLCSSIFLRAFLLCSSTFAPALCIDWWRHVYTSTAMRSVLFLKYCFHFTQRGAPLHYAMPSEDSWTCESVSAEHVDYKGWEARWKRISVWIFISTQVCEDIAGALDQCLLHVRCLWEADEMPRKKPQSYWRWSCYRRWCWWWPRNSSRCANIPTPLLKFLMHYVLLCNLWVMKRCLLSI